jgi:hypothetical protein
MPSIGEQDEHGSRSACGTIRAAKEHHGRTDIVMRLSKFAMAFAT